MKLVYSDQREDLDRKVREAILAVKLDRKFTKDEILERYLNTVYFGNGAYGVQAAAQTYSGIPARKLSPLQAATLAGHHQGPVHLRADRPPSAGQGPAGLRPRPDGRAGLPHQGRGPAARPAAGRRSTPRRRVNSQYAYFVSHVSGIVQDQFGYDETFKGGLRVKTTLDRAVQRAAEAAVGGHLTAAGDPSAALVAIDPATGAIRAMVGGKDFEEAQFNLATQAHRQAGSAFKPFTFATAMEQRISPKSIWKGPAELTIPDPRCDDQDGTAVDGAHLRRRVVRARWT